MGSNGISLRLIFKKAPFPAIMTILSFLFFILIYMLVTMGVAEPYYLEGLIFAVPFISFGLITLSTVKGKMKTVSSVVVTIFCILLPRATSIAVFYPSGTLTSSATTPQIPFQDSGCSCFSRKILLTLLLKPSNSFSICSKICCLDLS